MRHEGYPAYNTEQGTRIRFRFVADAGGDASVIKVGCSRPASDRAFIVGCRGAAARGTPRIKFRYFPSITGAQVAPCGIDVVVIAILDEGAPHAIRISA
jgi:hypothetical protein